MNEFIVNSAIHNLNHGDVPILIMWGNDIQLYIEQIQNVNNYQISFLQDSMEYNSPSMNGDLYSRSYQALAKSSLYTVQLLYKKIG